MSIIPFDETLVGEVILNCLFGCVTQKADELKKLKRALDTPASELSSREDRLSLLQAFKLAQAEAIKKATDSITLEEIDEIIAESRREHPKK